MKRELELLREKMRETGVDACLIPTSDFHGSEYVGDYFKCREYISKKLTNCCKHLCFNCLLFCTLIQYHVSLNLSTGNLKRFFVGFRP